MLLRRRGWPLFIVFLISECWSSFRSGISSIDFYKWLCSLLLILISLIREWHLVLKILFIMVVEHGCSLGIAGLFKCGHDSIFVYEADLKLVRVFVLVVLVLVVQLVWITVFSRSLCPVLWVDFCYQLLKRGLLNGWLGFFNWIALATRDVTLYLLLTLKVGIIGRPIVWGVIIVTEPVRAWIYVWDLWFFNSRVRKRHLFFVSVLSDLFLRLLLWSLLIKYFPGF